MSPAALALLQDLGRRGVEVRARGREILFRPKSSVPAEDLDLIRAYRGDLLRVLSSRPDFLVIDGRLCPVTWLGATASPPSRDCRCCGHRRWWRLQAGPGPWVCGRCHEPGPGPDEIERAGEANSE